MTTLTWTFVGGGELISYYIYWSYTYYIFIKLIFFLLADDYAGEYGVPLLPIQSQ
jgi:hypothetical protein